MKEKIIEIIGFGMERERAEMKANELIILFNRHLLAAVESTPDYDPAKIINKIFIPI
jgi:hypothetical protein